MVLSILKVVVPLILAIVTVVKSNGAGALILSAGNAPMMLVSGDDEEPSSDDEENMIYVHINGIFARNAFPHCNPDDVDEHGFMLFKLFAGDTVGDLKEAISEKCGGNSNYIRLYGVDDGGNITQYGPGDDGDDNDFLENEHVFTVENTARKYRG